MAKLNLDMPKLKIGESGLGIPLLGFGSGTAWFKTGPEEDLDNDCVTATVTALKSGFTHLDASEMYKTEAEVGKAIADSGVTRADIFVTTKCHQSLVSPGPREALAQSLKKLALDAVDLYLIHTPWFASSSGTGKPDGFDKAALQKAWAEMEALKRDGLAREIGVSNMSAHHLAAILETAGPETRPALNQIEFHPLLQRGELLALHKRHGIATAAYGPLVPLRAEGVSSSALTGYLAALAKKYAVSEAEILLRWCVEQDVVALTTTAKEQRMSDYLRVQAFKLTPREVEDICKMGREAGQMRYFWKDKYDKEDFVM